MELCLENCGEFGLGKEGGPLWLDSEGGGMLRFGMWLWELMAAWLVARDTVLGAIDMVGWLEDWETWPGCCVSVRKSNTLWSCFCISSACMSRPSSGFTNCLTGGAFLSPVNKQYPSFNAIIKISCAEKFSGACCINKQWNTVLQHQIY